jgi:hypothetical protein
MTESYPLKVVLLNPGCMVKVTESEYTENIFEFLGFSGRWHRAFTFLKDIFTWKKLTSIDLKSRPP